jgi:hypothetical protein
MRRAIVPVMLAGALLVGRAAASEAPDTDNFAKVVARPQVQAAIRAIGRVESIPLRPAWLDNAF